MKNYNNIANKHFRNPVLFLIILLSAILLSSCMTSEPYPSSWGNLMSENKYGDTIVSGNYLNRGTMTGNHNRVYSITDFLLLHNVKCDNFIVNVKSQKKIEFIFRYFTDTLYTTTYPDNGRGLEKNEEGFVIDGGKFIEEPSLLLIPISQGIDLTLRKSRDGSLIIDYYLHSFALLFFIPTFGSYSSWVRFPEYKTAPVL